MTTALVVVAGTVRAVLRFLVAGAVQRRLETEWPWGTATVNAVGALLIGVLAGLDAGGAVTDVLAGGLAGFTTFSTWMVEAAALWVDGRGGHHRAALDVLVPLGAGLLLVIAGWAIGGAL